jgi:hypothetical protein
MSKLEEFRKSSKGLSGAAEESGKSFIRTGRCGALKAAMQTSDRSGRSNSFQAITPTQVPCCSGDRDGDGLSAEERCSVPAVNLPVLGGYSNALCNWLLS